jgi:hypothetical protein
VSAGWPQDLVPVVAPDFLDRAISWLLDRGPADLRTSALRSYPIALAYLVEHHCEADVQATREAYRHARAELGCHVSAAELTVIQQALEAQGARALATRREVALVREAVEQVTEANGA